MPRGSRHHDFLPSAIAAMERPPAFYTRVVSALVILLTVIALLWAYWSKVDIVVTARGEVVPAGRVKVIQAPEQGVVSQILVDNGQIVAAGRPLIALDRTASEAEEAQLRIRNGRTLLAVQRLRAELGLHAEIGAGVALSKRAIDTEFDLYQSNRSSFAETIAQLQHKVRQARAAQVVAKRQVDKVQAQIAHLEAELAKKRTQAAKGLIPDQEVIDLEFELQMAHQELKIHKGKTRAEEIRFSAARENVKATRAAHTSELYRQLTEAVQVLKTTHQALIKARQRTARQVVKAPVSGVVQQLSVHTIGAVVQAGQKLLVIVPKHAGLQVSARILNQDIGFIEADQPVRVKVNAFEFTRYGYLDGRLEWVGSDALADKQNGPVYPARIALASVSMPNRIRGQAAAVVPGMRVTADIVIGQRRLIDYFVAPLLRYRDESLRER